eukprot:TRINITY_DN9538_c0_g1_i2.p1 TRINITY_DN9538_c0_g1~~TRINITY_DN9538_c0_g1_i2.p1  ORF type:complete len:304 (+),score=40.07 TRINITY_DN9538_c0_g1_i2:98-1009(+)
MKFSNDNPLLPGLPKPLPRRMVLIFTCTGVALMVMLSAIPVYNAVLLMQDANFTFWKGRFVPGLIFGLCVSVIISYAAVMMTLFERAPPDEQNYRTLLSIAQLFVAILGLVLVIMSYALSMQADTAYVDLMYGCPGQTTKLPAGIDRDPWMQRLAKPWSLAGSAKTSEQAYRLFEYSEVLHTIRATPACANQTSVEHCPGYKRAPPYTTFLKAMESDFKCSGFCFKPLTTAQHDATSDRGAPPTLFTKSAHVATCEHILARDMQNFAGDMSVQAFYQGISLLAIAIAMAGTRLVGVRIGQACR